MNLKMIPITKPIKTPFFPPIKEGTYYTDLNDSKPLFTLNDEKLKRLKRHQKPILSPYQTALIVPFMYFLGLYVLYAQGYAQDIGLFLLKIDIL